MGLCFSVGISNRRVQNIELFRVLTPGSMESFMPVFGVVKN